MAQQDGADIPSLLRFLTQTASIPLAQALSLAKPLHTARQTPTSLASTKPSDLQSLLGSADSDGKLSKQILAAAKRASKKRPSSSSNTSATDTPTSPPSATKRRRNNHQPLDPAERERLLKLPDPVTDTAAIRSTVLFTNRAPLLLAFAVALLKHTMPSQPETSRLSLAMTVMSAGARARARDLGIEPHRPAKDSDAGPGRGYKSVKILGRDIPVLRRDVDPAADHAGHPPYWGIDAEALNDGTASAASLPIHTPESAHAYLLKSFASADSPAQPDGKKTKKTAAAGAAVRMHNLALLLGALDRLFASWAAVLEPAELDRRAWAWYARVRPEVEEGRSGWGGRGEVRLAAILDLSRGGGDG